MSVINKEPFIKKLLKTLTDQELKTLANLIDGKGDRTYLKRTMNPTLNGGRIHISVSDKGVYLCNLQLECSLFNGYLIYNNSFCVLIYFTDAQVLGMFNIDVAKTKLATVDEALSVVELRSILDDFLIEVGELVKVQVDDIDSGSETANKVIMSDGSGGAEWKTVPEVIESSTIEDGNAAKLLGFDSEGNLIQDDLPEEIVVDDTIVEDSANAVAGGAVYTALETKANVDGNYPTLTAGLADNLTPYSEDSGATDTTPFVFQTSGGESDIGSQAYLKSLKGNSVAFNQLALALNSTNYYDESGQRTFNTTNNSSTYTADGTETAGYRFRLYSSSTNIFKRYSGHKYLITFKSVINTSITVDKYRLVFLGQNYNETFYTDGLNNWLIATPQYTDDGRFTLTINLSGTATSGDTWTISNLMIIDLTLMFGAGNEPTSVLEFNRLFPKSYYEYNVGTLLSCKSKGYKVVGYNAWDEEWEQGYINVNGNPGSAQRLRSKNFTRVIAGQNYSFYCSILVNFNIFYYDANKNFISSTTKTNSASNREAIIEIPENVSYIKFYLSSEYGNGTFYNNDIAIHLTWDGSRTGYEEHKEWQYNLPNIELKGGYDNQGNHWGDSLYPDGTLETGSGLMEFDGSTEKGVDTNSGTSGVFRTIGDYTQFYLQSSQFVSPEEHQNDAYPEYAKGTIIVQKVNVEATGVVIHYYLNVKWILLTLPTATASTASEANTWLSNNKVSIIYAKQHTTTQDDAYKYQEITPIDDFGTQEFLYDSDIAIPVPQGNEFFYPVDYKAFIDSLGGREDIEYAANQVVSQTQLANYLKTISGYDATKTQTLKNVNGTLTWVDDE